MHKMHTVTLTMPDMEARTTKEAAAMFLAALASADWSPSGMVFRVKPEPGLTETVTLSAAEVEAALRGQF